jgi:DNA-binding CsgD family transcriptional regulator
MTADLTPRTVRVIELIALGVSRLDTADRLGVHETTVISDIALACRRLQIPHRRHSALVGAAIRRGVITLAPGLPGELEDHLVDTLKLIADGYSNAEIAAELWLSLDAVKSRVKRILRDLDARDRAHAVAIGWQRGLLRRDWEVAA